PARHRGPARPARGVLHPPTRPSAAGWAGSSPAATRPRLRPDHRGQPHPARGGRDRRPATHPDRQHRRTRMSTDTTTPATRRLAAPAAAVAATTGAAYDEAITLSRRLKLPHLRRAMAEIVPTAKAQRWDPAEIVRALLAEEAAGRDAANLRTRRTRAAFPTGKTFHIWNETASSIPTPTQQALRTLEWVARCARAEIARALRAQEAAGRDAATPRPRRTRAAFPTGKTFHIWNETASSIPPPTQQALRTLEWVARRENLCVVGPSGTGKSHFCEALGQAAVDAGMSVAWFSIEDLGALVRRHRVDDSVSKAIARLTRTDLIIVDDIGLLPI